MKTSVKLWKTEILNSRQKTFLVALILTISILPSVSQDMATSGLKCEQPTQAIERQDSGRNESDLESSAKELKLDDLETKDWMNEIEYHARQFVDAEISLEIQTRVNNNQENPNESTFAETSKLEDLMKIAPYNAANYVEAEMLIEFTNHDSYEKFFDEAELITVEGCNKEIVRFAQNLVLLQEQKAEKQNFATAISN